MLSKGWFLLKVETWDKDGASLTGINVNEDEKVDDYMQNVTIPRANMSEGSAYGYRYALVGVVSTLTVEIK